MQTEAIHWFISYRRGEACHRHGGGVLPISLSLKHHSGANSVFLDNAVLRGRGNWRALVESKLQSATIVLAVIGKDWEKLLGERRKKEEEAIRNGPALENDNVRWELCRARELGRIIIPLLLGPARMPQKTSLAHPQYPLEFLRDDTPVPIKFDPEEFDVCIDRLIQAAQCQIRDRRLASLPPPPKVPTESNLNFENSLGMEMVWCPPGRFSMGSPPHEDGHVSGRERLHDVRLSRGFWIAATPVTRGQWRRLTESLAGPSDQADAALPMSNVTWTSADEFCKRLTEMEPRCAYSLPTEAQWEYACRAGSDAPFSGGKLPEIAWFADNSGKQPHPVGEKKPNAWGLHDMHGNVWEWCRDSARPGRFGYEPGFQEDPEGEEGDHKVLRGGSYLSQASACRAGCRIPAGAHDPLPDRGFRPICVQRD